jgi:hypothetical protein
MGWYCVELGEMRLGLRLVGVYAEVAASVALRAKIGIGQRRRSGGFDCWRPGLVVRPAMRENEGRLFELRNGELILNLHV